MSTKRKRAPTRAKLFVASDLFFCHVLRILTSVGRPAQITQLRYQGMILYERHVHYYAERGDLLRNRFMLMMKNDGFHRLETVGKLKWTSGKPFRCADAQWRLDNDSQSSPASLNQLSSCLLYTSDAADE